MKIAVLGGDGYCGWAHRTLPIESWPSVAIIDNFVRRLWDHDAWRAVAHADSPAG